MLFFKLRKRSLFVYIKSEKISETLNNAYFEKNKFQGILDKLKFYLKIQHEISKYVIHHEIKDCNEVLIAHVS